MEGGMERERVREGRGLEAAGILPTSICMASSEKTVAFIEYYTSQEA